MMILLFSLFRELITDEEENMKKTLLIIGIVCLVIGALALAFGLFSRFGYYHVLDGSSELYMRLHKRMVIGYIVAAVFAVSGAICLIMRSKT